MMFLDLRGSMLYLFLSCAPEEPKITGADLLDNYNNALCGVLSLSECGVEFANCGSPVVVFPDEDNCMAARNNLSEGCEGIESDFLNEQEKVETCVDVLNTAALSCSEIDICIEEQTILEIGVCAELQDLFEQCG